MKLKNNQTSINLNEVEKENMDFYLKYGFDPNDYRNVSDISFFPDECELLYQRVS